MPQIELNIAADHPAYAGHFPGQPILPGVVLLDAAQRLIESNGLTLSGLAVAKFHSPATPGAALVLDYTAAEHSVSFDIHAGTRKIASGQFTVRSIDRDD